MPKAEVGSTKYVANKMKAKGLQRLRWYCQICQKQCRDENGFKQHTLSEGHVRAMLMVGEDPKKYIHEYSRQFERDFLQLLRTAHGEKTVNMNNFYQEYIRDKEHVHMNATRWPSLTEFAKYLGREGICRVEEGERGLEIQWIDDSPEAIRRREDIQRKDRLAKGDEDAEGRLLEEQIKRAQDAVGGKAPRGSDLPGSPETSAADYHTNTEPVKVSLSLKSKAGQNTSTTANGARSEGAGPSGPLSSAKLKETESLPSGRLSLSLAQKPKAASNPLEKKNPLAMKSVARAPSPEKKMSNAERIMKEEIERKRLAGERNGSGGGKRQRIT